MRGSGEENINFEKNRSVRTKIYGFLIKFKLVYLGGGGGKVT